MYKGVLAVVGVLALSSTAFGQDWRTVTSLRQVRGEDALLVDVEYGAGNLTINPAAGNTLYKATLRYDANSFKPLAKYETGHLRVGIEGGSIKGRNMKSGRLDLTLTNRVPMELNLKFGAVEADMELGGLRIRKMRVQTGASDSELNFSTVNPETCSTLDLEVGAAEFTAIGLGNLNCGHYEVAGGVGDVTLDFNGAWRVANATVDVGMGLGSLTLRVPRGLGVTVRKSGVLASFDSQELIKRGNTFFSQDWEKAKHRVAFNIDAALGSIRIVWVEPEKELRKAQR